MSEQLDIFEIEGQVFEVLPNMMFRVEVKTGPEDMIGKTLLCTLAGKMKMFRIRVMLGDTVKADVSRYDKTRARITFRAK